MVALHYSMLHRFEIFLPLEQSRTALLGCRLAASRLREAARWQQSSIESQVPRMPALS